MITTYFCKKGGVGKTTVLGEHAEYLATKGNKVLIVSIDDQNLNSYQKGQKKLLMEVFCQLFVQIKL